MDAMDEKQRRPHPPAGGRGSSGRMARFRAGPLCVCLALLAMVAWSTPRTALAQEEDSQHWTAVCGSSEPLASARCRIEPVINGARPEFSVMFAYVGRELTFSIIGQRRFTQGEVRIDGKQVFVTRICGTGYCFMDGQLATQLAQQFRKGRKVEVEVSTPAHDVYFTAQYDLKGFETVFSGFAASGG